MLKVVVSFLLVFLRNKLSKTDRTDAEAAKYVKAECGSQEGFVQFWHKCTHAFHISKDSELPLKC